MAVTEGEGDPPLFPEVFPLSPLTRIFTEGAAAAVSPAAVVAVTEGEGDPPLFPEVFPLSPLTRIFTERAAAAVLAAAVVAIAEGEGDCRVGALAADAAAVGWWAVPFTGDFFAGEGDLPPIPAALLTAAAVAAAADPFTGDFFAGEGDPPPTPAALPAALAAFALPRVRLLATLYSMMIQCVVVRLMDVD